MKCYSLQQDLRAKQPNQRSQGFSIIDCTAYLFVVGLLILTFPLFWQPSAASTSSNNYRSRAVLPVRLVLAR
jgi:hypothetical protein